MRLKTKLIMIVLMIAVIAIIAYPVIRGSIEKVEVLNVMVRVEGNTTRAQIMDVTASVGYVNKIAEPKGSNIEMPGVTVFVIKDMKPIGYWTSVKYSGTGRYNLTVGLTEYPKPGDTVTVTARVTGDKEELDALAAQLTLT